MKNTKIRDEGRRKKQEGSSATDSVTDVTDVTDFSPMEVGRRMKDEGRFAQFSPSRPLALSPSPLLRSDRTSAVPDRPFASPVNAIFCKNTVNLYWKNISSS
ncbi:hypothetical protein QT970_19310 [Microcoleus sp. herbarium8]|uniref:hypothetical protein n=1 Tax=Microcoleus sp. herbarium8 TaxID=3055436 RepID=UPI002FD03E17